MAKKFSLGFGGVHLGSDVGDSEPMPPETPFRLLISGNLGGDRPNPRPLAQRKPIEIDRDNFDETLAKLAPSVTLAIPEVDGDLLISFRELDDFEPDRLFQRLPHFEELRTLRTEIARPSTFPAAAARIREWAHLPTTETSAPAEKPVREVSAAELLDQVLGETHERQADRGADSWQEFLTSIVKPQLVEKPDPSQADYEAVVEEAITARMRSILHHPRFQALEAAWRSVFLLVKRLPTDETLKLFVLDATAADWRADLTQDDPGDSVFVRELVEKAVDRPWAAFVSLETFGRSVADLEMLASMTIVAARSRTPILAAASSDLFGCRSLAADPDPRNWSLNSAIAEAWSMIRGLDQSKYLGLITPRFLLRLPYGSSSTRTESFDFEEMAPAEHEQYLWGSGAVAVALLLAEGYVASGWSLDPDDVRDIGDLPAYIFDDDGERTLKPVAEVHLRDTALEAIVDQGLMVLTSARDRGAVHLVRFQSAAHGGHRLNGRWEG